ncbi:MAG TPA: preprotein translocase subunit SecE [Mollicutes bacterium]|nr:preprotein translocase subunit SecE [Mollicutes bacterium]
MDKIKSFFHGVKKEIERVRWPNKKSMVKDSIAVLLFCFFLGIFFFVINFVVVFVKDVLR